MAGFSDYAENNLIDHLFRDITFAKSAALHVALFTSDPTDAASGTEVSGGSYARVSVAPGSTNWANTQASGTGASTGTGGATSNKNTITFPAPTANWGSVTHFAIFDAATSGNMLFSAALTTAKTVNNGDAAPTFAAGALVVTLS
jgi:hypothetical protein